MAGTGLRAAAGVVEKKRFFIRTAVFLACAGFSFVSGFLLLSDADRVTELESELEKMTRGCAGLVEGRVAAVRNSNGGRQLILDHCFVRMEGKDFELSGDGRILADCGWDTAAEPGERVRIRGKLQLPRSARNPGEFDFRAYYRAQRILCFLREGKLEGKSGQKNVASAFLLHLRERLSGSLKEMAGEEDGALFCSMLLGDKSGQDQEVRSLYQQNGIAHILAISGLHISLAGAGIWALLRKAGAGYWSAGASGFLFVAAYGWMTGGSVSAVRAASMYGVQLLSGCLGRTYDTQTALSAAALGILWQEPLQLFQSGFQLSFLSVLSAGTIFLALRNWGRLPGGRTGKIFIGVKDALLLSISVQLGTLPALCSHFFIWPPYGLLLNLAVIPLMTVVFLSGFAGIFWGLVTNAAGSFLLGAGRWVFGFYQRLCLAAGELPGAVQVPGIPELWKIIVYYVVLSLICCVLRTAVRKSGPQRCGRKIPGARIAVPAAVVLLAAGLFWLRADSASWAHLDILDVGQGDGLMLYTGEGTVFMIDGGSSSRKNLGEECLVPYLQSQGVSRIDCAVVSHGDEDHLSGLRQLLEEGFPIGELVLPDILHPDENYRQLEEAAKRSGVPVRLLKAGDCWKGGETEIRCLHPPDRFSWTETNSYSTVLKIISGDFRILLTGDLDQAGEDALLRSGADLSCNVLKVAHHGSRFSTSVKFLELADPQYAVISAGEGNSYGHPHRELIKRLEGRGIRIFQTLQSGMVRIVPGKNAPPEGYLGE